MFIILVTYVKPLEEVDHWLQAHREFLKKYFSAGRFFCAGRREPREGGVILCRAQNKEEVETIVREDPFHTEQIARYEIVELVPTMWEEGFEAFLPD